jgi:hypothetical protein
MSGAEAMVDHDCPLCQLMADSPTPVFWHLDGCNFDDEFAFSFHRTQQEWDDERREWEERNRKFNEEWAKREKSELIWHRSYSNPDAHSGPPALAVFGLASHLAELTQDLKEAGARAAAIEELNRCFGNVREVTSPPNSSLIEPVVERMSDALAAIGDEYPTLAVKCTDLARQIREFGERVVQPRLEDDVPF